MELQPLVNRVADSDIEVFDLAQLWDGAPVDEIDLAPWLHRGLVLREKDFRQHVKDYDWQQHHGRHVAVACSTDALIPTWAFMLVASRLQGVAASVDVGDREAVVRDHFTRALERFDWGRYQDAIVVVKGCGSAVVPTSAYVEAMTRLQGVARKLMYGEPCSSVPLWRRPAPRATGAAARPATLPAAKPAPPPGKDDEPRG